MEEEVLDEKLRNLIRSGTEKEDELYEQEFGYESEEN